MEEQHNTVSIMEILECTKSYLYEYNSKDFDYLINLLATKKYMKNKKYNGINAMPSKLFNLIYFSINRYVIENYKCNNVYTTQVRDISLSVLLEVISNDFDVFISEAIIIELDRLGCTEEFVLKKYKERVTQVLKLYNSIGDNKDCMVDINPNTSSVFTGYISIL